MHKISKKGLFVYGKQARSSVDLGIEMKNFCRDIKELGRFVFEEDCVKIV
jgi:hypothetical protein